MAKIEVKTPGRSAYTCLLDTGVMSVNILEAFNGIKFISADGEILSVVMRDRGFEVVYARDDRDRETQQVDFKDGVIKRVGEL